MKIVFEISYEQLADGRFKPTITRREEGSSQDAITNFLIEGSFHTKEEALRAAKIHAQDEAYKTYGSDAEVSFTTQDVAEG